MKDEKPLPPHLKVITDSEGKPKVGDEKETQVVGIPYDKEHFLTVFDNSEQPTVMIFSVPIRALAVDPGKDALAMLLGKMELFKGEAHKFYKAIKAEDHARRPQLVRPGGPIPPMKPGLA